LDQPPSRKKASLALIAAQAGVSPSTVSRIVNGQLDRANPKTIARVQALVAQYSFQPSFIGRSLRRGQSQVVAMLAPNLDNPAMGAIATSTEAALRDAGYVMVLCDTHDRPELQDSYFDAMRAQSVRGYVLVGTIASPGLKAVIERGEPAVLVGRRAPDGMGSAPFVGIDNRAAGADAAEFLLNSGVTRPALLHAGLFSSAAADRVAGFCDHLAARGVAREDIPIASSGRLQHMEAGFEAARLLAARQGWPEGMMCVSDQMAYGAWRLARESGVRVPEDCLIVGVDDNALNAWIAPWLTSVHVPYSDFGGAVVSQLQAIWAGETPADLLLPHRLVPRGKGAMPSSAPSI
jgi:LacI family transcriptional regulator